jgi:diguanylate cyclase (GGDEF)-like protein
LESAIVRAERQLKKLAVLYIDLDNFKPINDDYGHKAGDAVLIKIAQKLKTCFRKTDTLARLGGDEFAAIVDINDWTEAQAIVKKIYSVLERTTILEQNQDHKISASIGISCFPDDAGTAEELVNKADEAMYSVKRNSDKANSLSRIPNKPQ